MSKRTEIHGLPRGVKPYDWALRQLRIARAHKVTYGSRDVVVAVIDLGYRHHPALDGHLWRNPRPTKGDVHGWDFADNDASLEFTGRLDSDYTRGHHVFVVGEIAAVAPKCPIMIVRVGWWTPDSWWQAIRYAVDQSARILVIPHTYLPGERAFGGNLYYKGNDWSYPFDNPKNREALDYAYDQGCLTVKGTADNQGRRAAAPESAFDVVFTVGSANRRDEPADICCSADYVEVGAPGGQRHSKDETDRIWGCGGDHNYIPFTGGCMATGFASGVAALVWSKFPKLTNEQLREVLRNTARPARGVEPDESGWEPMLGYGLLDPARALSLKAEQMCRDVRLLASSVRVLRRDGRYFAEAQLENRSAFDAEKAIVVAYNGDPARPADPSGTIEKPAKMFQTKQIGHSIVRVRGLQRASVSIQLIEKPPPAIWFETFCLDRHDCGKLDRAKAASHFG